MMINDIIIITSVKVTLFFTLFDYIEILFRELFIPSFTRDSIYSVLFWIDRMIPIIMSIYFVCRPDLQRDINILSLIIANLILLFSLEFTNIKDELYIMLTFIHNQIFVSSILIYMIMRRI